MVSPLDDVDGILVNLLLFLIVFPHHQEEGEDDEGAGRRKGQQSAKKKTEWRDIDSLLMKDKVKLGSPGPFTS